MAAAPEIVAEYRLEDPGAISRRSEPERSTTEPRKPAAKRILLAGWVVAAGVPRIAAPKKTMRVRKPAETRRKTLGSTSGLVGVKLENISLPGRGIS
jgi:hypothetical protein